MALLASRKDDESLDHLPLMIDIGLCCQTVLAPFFIISMPSASTSETRNLSFVARLCMAMEVADEYLASCVVDGMN